MAVIVDNGKKGGVVGSGTGDPPASPVMPSLESPKGEWILFQPGLRTESMMRFVERPLDYVIFGATANGTVPYSREGFCSLPVIEHLVQREVAVFILPVKNSASSNLDGRSTISLNPPYESQCAVIAKGARILQLDYSGEDELLSAIEIAYAKGHRGAELSDAVCTALNREDFNQRQSDIFSSSSNL